jgi:hypothetical protein
MTKAGSRLNRTSSGTRAGSSHINSLLGASHFDGMGSNPTSASRLIIRPLSFEPGCMSLWIRLVFGVFMADNPNGIQITSIFEISPYFILFAKTNV